MEKEKKTIKDEIDEAIKFIDDARHKLIGSRCLEIENVDELLSNASRKLRKLLTNENICWEETVCQMKR